MIIDINIEDKRAAAVGAPTIVCGNSGYTIKFTFDDEWKLLSAKTARFVYVQDGKVKYIDVVFTGITVAVPVMANTKEVQVGVFAGNLQTTTPARIPCEPSIRCGTGAPADPTPSQYDQIMALLRPGGGGSGGTGGCTGTCEIPLEEKVLMYTLFKGANYKDDLDATVDRLAEVWGLNTSTDTTYTASFSISDGISVSGNGSNIKAGDPFILSLTAKEGYVLDSVTVIMGGKDVTSSAYTDGVVRIASVTGDINVIAKSRVMSLFEEVNWNEETAYVIGQNTQQNYNAWAPGNAVYDRTRGVVVFLQSHSASHAASTGTRTLCTVDPYRPMDYTMVDTLPHSTNASIGAENGVGGLVVDDDGAWHVYGKKYNYHSNDGGATWTTETVITAPSRMYGVTKIDGVLYAGDDSGANNGAYYTSIDNGLNWELKTFDFADDYPEAIKCCEASFCKFKGKIYANLRREMEPGIFARQDDSGWVVINDTMPNVSSDTTMYAVDDAIYMAAIDRPARKLILAYYDGEKIITRKAFEFTYSKHGDFHTPTYVVGDDFQMVTFMVGYQSEYFYCVNACVVGYKSGVEHYTPTYNIEAAQVYFSDINPDGPMTGTITLNSEKETPNNMNTLSPGYYNVSKPFAGCNPPDANGYVVEYGFCSATTFYNMAGTTTYNWANLHPVEIDGVMRLCLGHYSGSVSMKLMGEAVKVVKTAQLPGAEYCMRVSFEGNMLTSTGTTDFWKTCIITPAE